MRGETTRLESCHAAMHTVHCVGEGGPAVDLQPSRQRQCQSPGQASGTVSRSWAGFSRVSRQQVAGCSYCVQPGCAVMTAPLCWLADGLSRSAELAAVHAGTAALSSAGMLVHALFPVPAPMSPAVPETECLNRLKSSFTNSCRAKSSFCVRCRSGRRAITNISPLLDHR
jgi:hypothetical protein